VPLNSYKETGMLQANNIGKKYGKSWIFRKLSFDIKLDSTFGLTGKNGSGKSTLLQILSGYLTPTEGETYLNESKIDVEDLNAAYIGPYTEIIEEFTLKELLDFHSEFKTPNLSIEEMADRASLPLSKPISDFSTGMKQRTKLITAFFFEHDIIFMDEPASNLDYEGFQWWRTETTNLTKTILIASNDAREIELCESKVDL